MKKETFVSIIKAIQEQNKRSETLDESIRMAYEKAGECLDFRPRGAYSQATSLLQDALLEALSYDFVSENQTQESALDTINYYIYELEMMNWTFLEPKDPKENTFIVEPVPAYIEVDGVKLPLSTPEELYDTLVWCMENMGKKETVSEETHIASALNETKIETNIYDWVWEKLKPMLEAEALIEGDEKQEIFLSDKLINDLGLDSLDTISLALKIEGEFGIKMNADDFDELETVEDILNVIVRKMQTIKEVFDQTK